MRREVVVVSSVLVLSLGLVPSAASAAPRAVARPSSSCRGVRARMRFATFDAAGHVDTGLHGTNRHGVAAGYLDDGPGSDGVAYPTGFVVRAGRVHPVVWDPSLYTDLNDVNRTGLAVGYYGRIGVIANSAFVYDTRTRVATPLRFPSGVRTTIASGINDDGTIVGTLNVDPTGLPQNAAHNGYLKHRRDVGTSKYQLVSYPGAPETFGNGINNDGAVVGNYHTGRGDVGGAKAFVFHDETYSTIDLHELCAVRSEAWGINTEHDIVGFFKDAAGTEHGFVTNRHRAVSRIDVPGAAATRPYAVDDEGTITGTYDDASGISHGFVASIRPQHSSKPANRIAGPFAAGSRTPTP